MAFQQGLPGVSPDTGVTAAPASDAKARLLGGAADAVSIIGGAANTIYGDRRSIQSDQVSSDALKGILGLEEERDYWRGRETNINDELSKIAGSGDVTPEERERIKALEVEKKFLDDAKKTGVLSRAGYSTRYNALYRASLASAENLGIQTQISEIFRNNRSLIDQAPVEDPSTTKLYAAMDAQYGAGQWTADDAATYAAKNVQADTYMRGVESDTNMMVSAISTDLDKIANTYLTDEKSGRIITAEEEGLYKVAVNTKVVQNIAKLEAKKQSMSKAGILTPSASKRIDDAIGQVRAVEAAYTGVFEKDGRFAGMTAAEAMERTQKAVDGLNKLKVSLNAPLLAAVAGTGDYGKMGGDVLLQVLDQDSQQYARMLQVRKENSKIPGVTVESLRAQDAQMLSMLMTGGTTLEEAEQKGLISNQWKRWFSATATSQQVSTKDESDKQIEINKSLSVVPNDSVNNTANLQTLANSFDSTRSNATRTGNVAAHKAAVLDDLKRNSLELQEHAKNKTFFNVSINDQGLPIIELRPEFADDPALIGESGAKSEKLLRAQLGAFAAYAGKALEAGDLTPADIQAHFGTGNKVFDATTGADETVQGMLNRSTGGETLRSDQEPAGLVGDLSKSTPPPITDVVERTAWEENRSLDGYDSDTGRWSPHKSVEGGTDTLAYGHKLTAADMKDQKIKLSNGVEIDYSNGISDADAENILTDDLLRADKDARRVMKEHEIKEAPEEVDAILQQMAFQMGTASFRQFKPTFNDIAAGKYDKAATRLMKSKWARQTPERAARIAEELRALEPESTQAGNESQLLSIVDQFPADATVSEIREFLKQRAR